jgi:acyl-CoA synthetase (NDP forming)
VVVKVGRSDNASRMISAHTGAIAGEDRVYDAYFRQHGIARVADLDELVELGKLASTAPKPATKVALAAITLSGGEAALIADFGLDIPDLEPRTIERRRKSFPAYATPRNPIDAYGLGWDERRFAEIVEAVVDDRNVGIIAICMDTSARGGDDGDGMVP